MENIKNKMANSKIIVEMDTEKVQGLVTRVVERKIGGVCKVVPIREAGFDEIMKINSKCFPYWDETDTSDITFFHKSSDSIGFFLYREKKPTAYILGANANACQNDFELDDEKTFRSCYAGVMPKYRRNKLYSLLTTLRNVALIENEYDKILFYSLNNPDTINAQLANGYEKVALVKEHYDDGSDAWLWRKDLDADEIAEEVSSLVEALK